MSRRSDGDPGDFIADLPVNTFIHPAGLPTDTSTLEVLRRPVESAQYTSIAFTDRLLEAGIDASVGATGSSYDNALAETINGLYKTELIHPRKPWKTIEEVEIATLEWVDWFNHRRIAQHCDDLTPVEFEQAYDGRNRAPQKAEHSQL